MAKANRVEKLNRGFLRDNPELLIALLGLIVAILACIPAYIALIPEEDRPFWGSSDETESEGNIENSPTEADAENITITPSPSLTAYS